jgi:hypothetical protein
LGSREKVPAVKLPKLKYFPGMRMMNDMMAMNGDLISMDGMQMSNQIMDMNQVMYPEIRGEEKTGKQKKKMQNDKPDSLKGMDMDRKDNMQGHDMHNM